MIRQLRISVNGIFLNFEKVDFKITDENSSFSDTFKLPHNSYPVRIIEDSQAIKALGSPRIAKTTKVKTFDAYIYIGSSRYSGVLEVSQILSGFRKANLKFGSEIILMMERKIGSFFEVINFLNLPVLSNPYAEESAEEYSGSFDAWSIWAVANVSKVYPEVDFQLPRIGWDDKFDSTEKGDDWHYYQGYLNNRLYNGLWPNEVGSDNSEDLPYWGENNNIISPQVFLLSPLKKFAEFIGYKLKGQFVNDPFIHRILFSSFKDNMYKRLIVPDPVNITGLDDASWQTPPWGEGFNGLATYRKRITIDNPGVGTWKLKFRFLVHIGGATLTRLKYEFNGEEVVCFEGSSYTYPEEFSGELVLNIDDPNDDITFSFYCSREYLPDYDLYFTKDVPDTYLYDPHPTLDFNRYLPDWSVSSYLNNLQNFFNLDIGIDEITKTIAINYNEENYLIQGAIFNLRQKVLFGDAETSSQDSFILKFDNDLDTNVYLSNENEDINGQKTDYTTEIVNKFKYIPVISGTARYSNSVEDKGGIGLMIYSNVFYPNIDSHYLGKRLALYGDGGILDLYWRRWLLFRLNAYLLKIEVPLTATELLLILKYKKISANGQLFLVKKSDYRETDNGFLMTNMELESVNL